MAYVNFCYGKNLLAGNGLGLNPDERCEGFTSILHLALTLPLVLFSAEDPSIYYRGVLSVNAMVAAAALTLFQWKLARRAGRAAALIVTIPVAASPLFSRAVWAGTEFSLALVLAIGLWGVCLSREGAEEQKESTTLLCVLAALSVWSCRWGWLFPAACAVHLGLNRRSSAVSSLALGALAAAAGLLLFRGLYFGHLVPHRFAWNGSAGFGVVSWYIFLNRLHLPAAALLFLVSRNVWAVLRYKYSALCLSAFLGVVPLLRLFLLENLPHQATEFALVLPFVFLGLYEALSLGRPRMGKELLWLLFLLVTVPLCFVYQTPFSNAPRQDGLRALGAIIRKEGTVRLVACAPPGKVAAYCGAPVLDLTGRCFPTLLEKGSRDRHGVVVAPEFVFDKSPDFICARILPDLSLAGGMTTEMYHKAGYRLRYLCGDTLLPILDTEKLSSDTVKSRIRKGYGYGVLERL